MSDDENGSVRSENDHVDLARLEATRKIHREQVAKLLGKIETLLSETETSIDDHESVLSQLLDKDSILKSLDEKIELLLPIAGLAKEIEEVDACREEIVNAKVKLQNRIKTAQALPIQTPPIQTLAEHPSRNEALRIAPKLPKLTIAKYFGDSDNYLEFWSQYENSIHKNSTLSDVDKFSYLKSLLGGKALACIKGFAITSENYQKAITLIQNSFGQKDVLISAHTSNLLNLNPVKNSSNVQGLRNLYFQCQTQIRSLESLGVKSDSYSTLLSTIVLKLFPSDLALEFNKAHPDSCHSLDELMAFLYKAINAREKAFHINPSDSSSSSLNKKPHFGGHSRNSSKHLSTSYPSASELLVSAEAAKCLFCNSNHHKSNQCEALSVEEKKSKLMDSNRCLLCLQLGCRIRSCRSGIVCSVCRKKHSEAICFKRQSKGISRGRDPEPISPSEGNTTLSSYVEGKQKKGFLLQCVKTEIVGENVAQEIIALFDNGSQRSFISKSVSRKLRLKILGRENISIFSFGCTRPKKMSCNRVEVVIRNIINGSIVKIQALEIDSITKASITLPPKGIWDEMNERGLELTFAESDLAHQSPISLLIGQDWYWDLTQRVERLNSSKLVALETSLGWSLQGNLDDSLNPIVMNLSISEEQSISFGLSQFWQLESLGISSQEDLDSSDKRLVESFESSIEYQNGRYTVTLPWKPNMQELLEDNKHIAVERHIKLLNKLKKNPPLFNDYKKVLDDYKTEGIIEAVHKNKAPIDRPVFYLPHRSVVKEDRSTTKVRIVFDGSCKGKNNVSLNECLFTGPHLNPDLLELMIKFRENVTAFTADVKQAYLMLELNEKDRDVTRFLWTDDPFETNPDNFDVYRFTRVLFGLNSSPFLLAGTIRYHLKKFVEVYPETVKLIHDNLYVDDLISGHENADAALKVVVESMDIFDKAGMLLRKWQTNDQGLKDLLQKNGIPQDSDTVEVKVLGMLWNVETDTFSFESSKLVEFASKGLNTKRFVLQTAGRVFDPVGFLSPYIVRIKWFIQQIWTLGLSWDDPLPSALQEEWQQWCQELVDLSLVNIPRCYFSLTSDHIDQVELHVFADASKKAYGCVAYLRFIYQSGKIEVSFVTAKTRVTPLKTVSLPRLELLAALLAARLCAKLLKTLKYQLTVHLHTDSTITLTWIKGRPERFKQFVRNRVQEIQSLTDPSDWSHCPGKTNPADILTRGLSLKKLATHETWWHGPPCLQQPGLQCSNASHNEVDESQLELRPAVDIAANVNLIESKKPLFELEKFSSLTKVLRVTAWVMRFVGLCRKTSDTKDPFLRAEELDLAENFWIRETQAEFYREELDALKSNKEPKKDSEIRSLRPVLDEQNILRISGRLGESDLEPGEKQPILLPKTAKFTELLVMREHVRVANCGVSATLAQIRRKFWIPRGRQLVKKVIGRCLVCRKSRAKPANQLTAQLPLDRIAQTPPFEVIGLGFAGPVYVKGNEGSQKAYISLFVCAVTRAVHLELVSAMSTKAFLLALRRFFARRGNCSVIYSDNARTFKYAERELSQFWNILRDKDLQNYLANQKVSWKFIVERAPWWGGFYERLVKTVKDPLRKILGKSLLDFEELSTMLTEIELIVNLRPLTYVCNDIQEPQALTPSHFLHFGRNCIQYPINFALLFDSSRSKDSLLRRKRYQTALLSLLWRKWKMEYLLQLKTAHNLKTPQEHKDLGIGDVVLIEGNSKSKFLWELGRISEVFRGRDNHVRACMVKTAKGFFRKPIQLLYPLELDVF